MDFLNFFAERLNVSRSEASQLLEQALSNYRPKQDYSSRIDLRDTQASAPRVATARVLATHGSA